MGAAHEREKVMPFPKSDQRGGERGHLPFQLQQLVLDVESHIHGDLIVAAASRVDLLPEIAERFGEAAFDGHVDILVGLADLELPGGELLHDGGEFAAHLRRLGGRDDGRHAFRKLQAREHRDMRGGAGGIPLHQFAVKDGIVTHRVVEHVRINVARYCLFDVFHRPSPILNRRGPKAP